MNGEQQNPNQGQPGQLNQQAVQSALQTGLKMLNSDQISTPNAWNRDLTQLEQIIVGLLSGQLRIIPGANAQTMPQQPGGEPPPPPPPSGQDGSKKPN